MEKTKFHSASQVGLLSFEERKKPRFVSSNGLPKNENLKVKIRSGGLSKNETPKVKICSGGLLKNGKRRTFKIRSGGFLSFQGTEKTKDSVSGSLEKVEPRFISLVSRVDSDKQKKPKIRNFDEFPKDQDS
ncbi:hypothetical protein GLOIN_2v1779851 [Rhizophagus irregularis DAOM 181602=DAOM 197198]|nr:hypothetical protein GLOIN_2v1779851 [Rhizophagus irregularis DAOM 181602=DAOM 197198]